MEVKKDILWRVYVSFIIMIVVGVAIFSKAFTIQQVEGSHWRSMSDSLHEKIQSIEADRGTIYSADGQMLSTSVPQFNIYVDFGAEGLRENDGKRFKENLDSLSYGLAALFQDKSQEEYKRILQQGYKSKKRYFLLQQKVSFEDYKILRKLPLVRLGRNKSGFIAETKNIRLNPYQMLAFRTIGLERQNAQKIGLEKMYDSVLQGTQGKRLVRYIAGGVAIPVDEDFQIEPENGKDITTTIDTHIQEIAENALLKMMESSESVNGCAIVMDVKTGAIKALANLGRRPDGSYWEDYNYAMRTTEPGSTIKLATLLAVLSEGKTTLKDPVVVGSTGSAYVGVRMVNDAERAPKPILTVEECFAHSSNVGMSKIAYNTFATQPKKFLDYLHKYHLDTITGIDLPGEEKPRLPKMSKSNEGLHAMVTMSFGYAILVSPLQTLTLYNAVANNGKMMRPYLVNAITNDGLPVKEFSPFTIAENIATPEVIKAAQESMHDVTIEGTAKSVFKNTAYAVAGKTGTAHVADGKYGYNDGVYQASFVGYFPYENPLYSCIVVIKTKPYAALHYGGQLAAPVFKEISDRLYTLEVRQGNKYTFSNINDSNFYRYAGQTGDFKLLMKHIGIPYKDSTKSFGSWSVLQKSLNGPVLFANKESNSTMPDLKGLGLKDAIFLCENAGLKVDIKGRGKVFAQSVNKGNTVSKGQVVQILLN